MMQLKGSSGKNPLVQRVQRYTTMSAIFRSPEPTAVHPAGSGDETADMVVNTFVIPPYSMAELPPMASSTAAASPHQETSMEPTAATASTAVASQKEAFRPSSPAPAGQPAALQRTTVFTPTAISKPSPDNWWSRLKSATRRLQHTVTGGPAQAESALSPAAPASPEIRPDVETITAVSPAPAPPIQRETVAPLAGQTPPLALIPIQDQVSLSQSASSTPAVPLPFTAAAVPPSPANLPAAQQNIPAPAPAVPEADPTTRRLDQIMRLHREKGTIETPPKPETTQPETTQPETAVSSSLTLPPAIQREAPTPAPPPGKTPTGELPAASADPISRRLDQIMRQHRQKGTIETPPGMTAPALQKEESAINEPSASQPAAAIEIEDEVRDSETAVSQTEVSETAVPPTFSTPPAETQPIPLQSVWPVQVMAAPPPASRPSPAPAATPLMRQAAPQETVKVRQQLDSVPPGQPTASSVQFVQPRKPRPQHILSDPQPILPTTHFAAANADSVVGDNVVATEIGDLPGDLWRLIGAKPPAAPPGQRPPLQQSPVVPAVTESEPAQTTAVTQAKTAPPTIIQRIESEQTPAADLAPTTEAPPSPESEQDEAGQNEEIDINELARQVYVEIKDRMTIEWERTRGRF